MGACSVLRKFSVTAGFVEKDVACDTAQPRKNLLLRQNIRQLILQGQIEEAYVLLEQHFPGRLEAYPAANVSSANKALVLPGKLHRTIKCSKPLWPDTQDARILLQINIG